VIDFLKGVLHFLVRKPIFFTPREVTSCLHLSLSLSLDDIHFGSALSSFKALSSVVVGFLGCGSIFIVDFVCSKC